MRFLPVALLTLAVSATALAHGDPWSVDAAGAGYRTECSACHIAFPPGLLTADDWLALLSDLEHHFGANAALEPPVRMQITDFLTRSAAASRAYASLEEMPRLTSTRWFINKHRGALRMLTKGKVKSLAECTACHKGPEIDQMAGE